MRKEKRNVLEEPSLLNQYLTSSPHCIELFNIWNDARGVPIGSIEFLVEL